MKLEFSRKMAPAPSDFTKKVVYWQTFSPDDLIFDRDKGGGREQS